MGTAHSHYFTRYFVVKNEEEIYCRICITRADAIRYMCALKRLEPENTEFRICRAKITGQKPWDRFLKTKEPDDDTPLFDWMEIEEDEIMDGSDSSEVCTA